MKRTKRSGAPGISVAADWFGDLPRAQLQAFRGYAKELETPYLMFSVSLDEAISLHYRSFLMDSSQVLIVASALCGRFVALLEDMLRSLAAHCKDTVQTQVSRLWTRRTSGAQDRAGWR